MLFKKLRLPILLLCAILLTKILLSLLLENLVSEDMVYQELMELYDHQKILELLQRHKDTNYTYYVFICLFTITKITLTFTCIYTGLLALDIKPSYIDLLTLIILAEFIFIMPSFTKLIWFTFIETRYSLKDIQNFSDYYSVSGLIDINEYRWLSYPFHLINLFEACYWMILAYGLKSVIKTTFWQNFKFVALTYGIGLAICVLAVMFLILSVT